MKTVRREVILMKTVRREVTDKRNEARHVGGACAKVDGRDTPTLCHVGVRTPDVEGE